ncbi:MAG: recombinase family protein [Cohaesibacter sp.]|nr:recombinase family protein [Cohaesibacter sp.]
MHIGYARTSTVEQVAGYEAQQRDLEAAGCERIFQEQVSSVAQRDQLEEALRFVREGDTLVVTKLDRLARSTSHLIQIIDQLEAKQVALRILDFGGSSVDTKSPTGRLVLTVFGAIAQWERECNLERQREGIYKAKLAGKYKGRKKTAMAKMDDVKALRADKVSPTEISRRLGISRSSVYRIYEELDGKVTLSGLEQTTPFNTAEPAKA